MNKYHAIIKYLRLYIPAYVVVPFIDFSPALSSIKKMTFRQMMLLLHDILMTYQTKKQMEDYDVLLHEITQEKLNSERHSRVPNHR